MGETDLSPTKSQSYKINDFCLTICTVNGSGSATANNTIFRSLFRMGIPVSGKNIFPSNIKGEATWFVIRASQAGYLGRVEHDDMVVCMNQATILDDIKYCIPGGVVFYADHIDLPEKRDDLIYYPMPIKQLSKQANFPRDLRTYLENMLYVGIVAQVLGIDLDCVKQALDVHFGGKENVVSSNFEVIKLAADWASENLIKTDRYKVKLLPPLSDQIICDGNTAAALGALFGGVQFCGWYPITPATSLVETMIERAPQLRKDPETGKDTYAIIQAEDELAAIGMVCGAGWAGLRSMTATSGPGLSLMVEYLGLAYYTEVPLVVWDVQRVGPSTGLPTRTSQGDITMVNFLGHGDTDQIMLFPSSVNECFEFGWKALDLAERFQAPIFVLSDLDLGMNNWITKKFYYPEEPLERGKVLWEDDLERLEGDWGRYLDKDGDGICYRTVMGNLHPKAAYFARGTGHDEHALYSENPEVWKRMMDRLKKKYQTAREQLPEPIVRSKDHARIGLISLGTVDFAVIEAQDLLEKKGIMTDYMRIRALPTSVEVDKFINEHQRTYVIEANRDGQLCQILSISANYEEQRLHSIAFSNGLPLTAKWIMGQVENKEKGSF